MFPHRVPWVLGRRVCGARGASPAAGSGRDAARAGRGAGTAARACWASKTPTAKSPT